MTSAILSLSTNPVILSWKHPGQVRFSPATFPGQLLLHVPRSVSPGESLHDFHNDSSEGDWAVFPGDWPFKMMGGLF